MLKRYPFTAVLAVVGCAFAVSGMYGDIGSMRAALAALLLTPVITVMEMLITVPVSTTKE